MKKEEEKKKCGKVRTVLNSTSVTVRAGAATRDAATWPYVNRNRLTTTSTPIPA